MLNYKGEPPSKKALKEQFIDANANRFSTDVLNSVARMILAIENPEEVINVALEFLMVKLNASRANGGFSKPKDQFYNPIAIKLNKDTNGIALKDFVFSNQLEVFQKTWKHNSPFACSDISNSLLLHDSIEKFDAIGSQSFLMQRFAIDGEPIGIVCVDFTNEQHVWSEEEKGFMNTYTETFLGPIAGISHYWNKKQKHQSCGKPSSSELAAIRLASKGMSYKEIACNLSKSVRTIENQLRNARLTLSASNQAELINKCQTWL
ncbi:MAG: sigma factor-like helix-turn-helix DNA-binding protein [Methylotenera sp.]